jgi:aminocarboxymuconate-semialdehyde decarboxylase
MTTTDRRAFIKAAAALPLSAATGTAFAQVAKLAQTAQTAQTPNMIIDMHAHALSERFLADLVKTPQAGLSCKRNERGEFHLFRDGIGVGKSFDPHLVDLPTRLASLKRRHVERQLFAPPPGLLCAPGYATGVDLARLLQDQQDDIVNASEGLMEGVAVLALGEPSRAADELKRAVEKHGYRAAMIPTTAGGRPLDDPIFEPLFDMVEKLGITLIMHPASSTRPDTLAGYDAYEVQVLVGWPGETSLAIARLIYSGFFEKRPTIKLVLCHGGGTVVFLRGRLDAAYEANGWEAEPYFKKNITKPPSQYLDHLYYDSCALSTDSNRWVIDIMGVDRVVFGSDYPFDIGDPEGRRSVPVIDSLPAPDRAKIYKGNAEALLARKGI